jgi:L-asparaginase
VLAVRVFPGLDAELVRAASGRGVKGLVLEAYGTGNLPRSLISALEHVHASGVPMMIVSQCLRGFVELGRYAGGAAAEAAGAISGGDMTAEAAIAKLMIGLGRYGPTDALKDYLLRDIIGERA